MLDLDRLDRIKLRTKPFVQRAIASAFLTPNYRLPPRVRISVEGLEHLPKAPVIFAMNHTDRYNYWPFQYELARRRGRYTATWVKGKYFENEAVGWFLEHTNNLPTVSRGYIISRDFLEVTGEPPSKEQYRFLRAFIDDTLRRASEQVSDGGSSHSAPEAQEPLVVPSAILSKPRNILGIDFDPARESYGHTIQRVYRNMMDRFTRLHAQAFEKQIDILIFPQGTRSKQLSSGHAGLAHIALHFGAMVVPVGCSGSDALYPGSSPWAHSGDVVYRVGAPIDTRQFINKHKIPEFKPFSQDADRSLRQPFRIFVDRVMDEINGLVDPPYRYGEHKQSQGVSEVSRFI